jgi:hypothetical protein
MGDELRIEPGIFLDWSIDARPPGQLIQMDLATPEESMAGLPAQQGEVQ